MKSLPIVVMTIAIAGALAGGRPLYLACNPQIDQKVVTALADAPEAMKVDGTYKRITADYGKRFAR